MKTYKVLVTETIGGWCEVEANNEEEAEEKAQELIDNEGGVCIYKNTHRETNVVGSTEEV